MKDIYFSGSDRGETDYLTDEEKELIRHHREEKIRRLNSDDSFIRRPANPKIDTADIPKDELSYYNPLMQNRNQSSSRYNDYQQTSSRAAYAGGYQPQGSPSRRSDQYSAESGRTYAEDYDTRTPPRVQPTPPKKKKKRGCGCLLAPIVALFLVAVMLFAGTFGYVYSLMEKTEKIDIQQTSAQNLRSDKDILNILLIGLDEESGGISRSDTMMLLSIDKINKALKLTSFLRDMWVDIPGHNSAKLNASFAYGGIDLTIQTLENNFSVDIDHSVIVDFNMFKNIIDALGGIDVEITQKEADFINRTTSVTVKPGVNHLNGKSALIYARIRKLDSDFNRTERQRKVISSIIDKSVKSDIFELLKLLKNVMPLVKTDIDTMQLTELAFGALKYIKFDVQQLQVPADDAYSSQRIRGQAALVPDMDKNRNNIISFIYG